MAASDKGSPRVDQIPRSLSSHAACGYKLDSPRKIVYDSQFRNDHAQAAKEVVVNSIIRGETLGNEGRLDKVYGISSLISKDVSPVRVIRIDKRRTNQSVVRDNSVDRFNTIKRGMSDNVSGMKYDSGLRVVRQSSSRSDRSPRSPSVAKYGHVYLNIYDLEKVNRFINNIAHTIGAAAYHAGVEVYGQEYNYGFSSSGGTGVMNSFPRVHPSHTYRKSVDMGRTRFSPVEVHQIVERLRAEWPGKDYDLLKRNCLNFADEFCVNLGVGGIPEWVMGLQNKINWTKSSLNSGAAKIKVRLTP